MKKKPLTQEEIDRQAVRNIVPGDKDIPIGEIGEKLKDAFKPTNEILRSITRAVAGLPPG